MSIEIEEAVLKKACMEMIETILFCLPNAFKGTIYRVGKMPDLVVERITSGIIDDDRISISWGLPSNSGYSYPGKSWIEYRDEPGRPLEAMGWCVERQKSWTAEDPSNDSRSVRLQLMSQIEDFQHMEPVLVRKSDLNLDMYSDFPKNHEGETIWKESEYVVVAVVKIHFRPYTIRMNSAETRVIKKLSRSLGTELLSYQLRQDSVKAMEEISKDRFNACNILADSLRNAITKSGLIVSIIKQEVGHLREQWEDMLLKNLNEKSIKEERIKRLEDILAAVEGGDKDLRADLINVHRKFQDLSLPPELGRRWIEMQLERKWSDFIKSNRNITDMEKEFINQSIDELKKSLGFGMEPDMVAHYNGMPEDLKKELVRIIYEERDSFDAQALERLLDILANPSLNMQSKERSRKILTQLKVLAETMSQLERNTNFLLHQVLNGNGAKKGIGE
ncbi:MAG: hypothetical protein JW944_06970 [Deltaproteobacteria bacterium]|nr:hypothetical protein [Deltaproteobacteria bacterium]